MYDCVVIHHMPWQQLETNSKSGLFGLNYLSVARGGVDCLSRNQTSTNQRLITSATLVDIWGYLSFLRL